MDWTRKADLELLTEGMKNAQSMAEQEWFEKKIWKIMGESAPIAALREDLVRAVSNGDKDRIDKIQQHIHAVRMEETNGHSFGNNKAEEIDKYE